MTLTDSNFTVSVHFIWWVNKLYFPNSCLFAMGPVCKRDKKKKHLYFTYHSGQTNKEPCPLLVMITAISWSFGCSTKSATQQQLLTQLIYWSRSKTVTVLQTIFGSYIFCETFAFASNSVKFVSNGPVKYFVQIMAWWQRGDKVFAVPLMV